MNSDMTKYCYQHFENAYNIGGIQILIVQWKVKRHLIQYS